MASCSAAAAQPRFVRGRLARQSALAHPVQRGGQRQIGILRQCGDRSGGLDAARKRRISAPSCSSAARAASSCRGDFGRCAAAVSMLCGRCLPAIIQGMAGYSKCV